MPERGAPALLFVCTTCDRAAGAQAPSRGRLLAEALQHGARDFEVREVACLNGCPNPCNVALRGHGRWTWRFSGCTLGDVPALRALTLAYWRAPRGELAPDALPPGLVARISARTPPPGQGRRSARAHTRRE